MAPGCGGGATACLYLMMGVSKHGLFWEMGARVAPTWAEDRSEVVKPSGTLTLVLGC